MHVIYTCVCAWEIICMCIFVYRHVWNLSSVLKTGLDRPVGPVRLRIGDLSGPIHHIKPAEGWAVLDRVNRPIGPETENRLPNFLILKNELKINLKKIYTKLLFHINPYLYWAYEFIKTSLKNHLCLSL